MVYEKEGFTLYSKDVKLKNTDKIQTIYFFAKKEPKSGTPCDMPDGFEVGSNNNGKFFFVRRIK